MDPHAGADASALPAGCRIKEYEIERTLGGGGFGLTYLAHDRNLNLQVALKEYYPGDLAARGADHAVRVRGGGADGGDGDAAERYQWGLERFLDEARALATFRHRSIVRVLRYFRDNGTAYIVMEYETGEPLKRWVPHNAPLSQRALLSILNPLLDGLEQVHQAGFLHRDIKPDNIYVRADGTPVLLDFGSARRVSTNQDFTNIVSPGFAPFEQYHSQGHEGPWTDLYSIGAVLYWMATGRKPLESAARVKTDSMPGAAALGNAAVHGADLLRAIEWAMRSDEAARPQSVAEFREAIRSCAAVDTGMSVPVGGRGGGAASGQSVTGPSGTSSTPTRRNLLGTVLALDLVAPGGRAPDELKDLRRMFAELVASALRAIPDDQRATASTPDGLAVCFMGDPEEALKSGLLVRDLLTGRHGRALGVRVGLHMGPVRLIPDTAGRLQVMGDGINVAQRVMDFAQPNQVLVSRAYYDVVSRITDDAADTFSYLGPHEDRHGRVHELYAAHPAQRASTTRREGPSTGYSMTIPARPALLTGDEVLEVETELARHIGPMARMLVRKESARSATLAELAQALAAHLDTPPQREAFMKALREALPRKGF
ncbi:protein kinase [Ramlibacter sp.]|uniref:protein kinase domain-containing protein n=1 Tax=Ramlibacter sp. TaxID=1917967 RepID=UPI0017F0D49E|nr:protein kinase [Ramlibacter sp.]MBA2674053.1 protein kinase [Ramlibacter sp.]